MAGGLTLIPSYTEDHVYPSYQDRLLIKSLGVQAGVVEAEDYKVTAGSGLQVNVAKGKAFVEQTKAIEESSNTFYNGLYNVLNPTEQNPYNNVEIPTTNPQIAQIILRVYDIPELQTSGSSYGRIEWLNGTANAGATKAHVEAGEALSFGAATLPTSSYRVAYVVVPKNATISSEFEIIDARKYSVTGAWKSITLGPKALEESSLQTLKIRTEDGGTVARLRGGVKSGTEIKINEEVMTIPLFNYARPLGLTKLTVTVGSTSTFVEIASTGRMQCGAVINAGSSVLSLDGITFPLT